jgi:hypothetical protein
MKVAAMQRARLVDQTRTVNPNRGRPPPYTY